MFKPDAIHGDDDGYGHPSAEEEGDWR